MAIIKEILAAEELEKIAKLLGLKQEALKQYTLQTAKEALNVKLRLLKDEELEAANHFLDKLDGLDKQDWENSLSDSNTKGDTPTSYTAIRPRNLSPLLVAYFGADEKNLLDEVNRVYNEITGKQPECKLYKNHNQLKNDTTLPESVKQALLSKPFAFILARLEFNSQKQLDTFMEKISIKAMSKFVTPSPAATQQTEAEVTQQANYSSPSPFSTRPTPMSRI